MKAANVIKSLESKLADLTYILFIIGKEFELIAQKNNDGKVKENLNRVMSVLRDSNSDVIRLYHVVKSNEAGIQNEWYNDDVKIKGLQHEVDNLSKSIEVLLEGNKNFLSNNL